VTWNINSGGSLSQRHNGGVFLTLAGQKFHVRVRKDRQKVDAGAKDVAAIGRVENGRIKIGIILLARVGLLA
jgi:DNA-binding transcriptional LysR family regulator